MKAQTTILPALSLVMACGALADPATPATRTIDAPPATTALAWPDQTPANCPFPKSAAFPRLTFTGRHAEYTQADTWYPSWASDGKMYSPFTDGTVNGLKSGSGDRNATTGSATIIGDDPLNLIVTDQRVYVSHAAPYASRYPCGSLVYNGVWYYGTYCLHPAGGVNHEGTTYNWPWLGPFVGFRHSTDFGKTWTQTPRTPEKPLFGEHALKGEPVKIGAPHFVDFGKNMEHSPDGKAYLVAHGASDGANRRFGYNSWITGDEIYLLRVTPTIENMNDPSKYEFFDGAGWTHDFAKIKPIAAWRDHMGCVTMTYNAPLKKYLMCVTDGGNTTGKYDSYILESDHITGPFKQVQYLHHFGEQGYFVNIPSKFISADGKTMWLCYSANFCTVWKGDKLLSNPPGSKYAMCLQEFKLPGPNDPAPAPSVLEAAYNVARTAAVTTSSVHPDYSAVGVVDGHVDGFPGGISREWASNGERETATLRLTWNEEQTVDRVWLFDRPNNLDQITGGMLIFSDGSTLPVGALPDDAKQGVEFSFPPKKVKWLIFAVTAVKPGSLNIGLSEIAVFGSPTKQSHE
jgi:hypothetical protein